jgi:hypothetical protein
MLPALTQDGYYGVYVRVSTGDIGTDKSRALVAGLNNLVADDIRITQNQSLLLEEGISGGRFLWSMQSNVSRKFVFIYKLTHVSCIPIQNETYHFSIWKCSILVTFFFLLLYTFGTR